MKKDWHLLISQPQYEITLEEDVWVPMRDGGKMCVDVYRPNADGKFPALVSFSEYGKDQQKLPTCPTWQPSDYERGNGGHECGEQWYFVPRGYVQVIPDLRGVGKSEGKLGISWGEDGYDLIEWIAAQPWSNGNVGMIGMSAFALSQFTVAAAQPPHLKAIFPFEAFADAYRTSRSGLLNYRMAMHTRNEFPNRYVPQPASFKEFNEQELRERIKAVQDDPDFMVNHYLYVITLAPQTHPGLFDSMMHPYDGPYYRARSAYSKFKDIKIPAHLGSRWDGWGGHMAGAFHAYEGLASQTKKLLMVPCGMDRPFHEVQDIILRWYDHWLKGNDTGYLEEPPILLFIQGINKWRYEKEWPLSATRWTKFYLRDKGRLSATPPDEGEAPQTFTSNPWARPNEGFGGGDPLARADPVPKIVYETEPLLENTEVTGPLALYWHASIESKPLKVRSWKGSPKDGLHHLEPIANDTDWYIKVKDIDVDGSERLVSQGWLKASRYELDESRSKPWAPYHPHVRSLPIKPDEIILYASDVRVTSNVFLMGHRIRLEIAAQDQVRELIYFLPHMAEVKHIVYSTPEQPSYLLLPLMPRGYKGAGEPTYPPEGPFRMPKYKRV
ncbi:MAG: CocE/NonD family hydrolase [Chloroflexi bacterium]|nr:CocE/NonD family hydrolase [Chloroflexota bacterium]